MQLRKMLKVFLALMLMSVLMFVVACGNGGAADDPPVDAPPPAVEDDNDDDDALDVVVPPADGINRDGIFTYGGAGWDGVFNAIMHSNIYDSYVNTLIFEGLITNNALGEPIPLIATHWELSNENLTYTFFINPLAAFSDGRPVTAHDVEFTFTTIAAPEYDGPRTSAVQFLVGFEEFNEGLADSVEGIRVIDDLTIEFTHVIASPQNIWNFGFGILCREYYAWNTWDDFMALIDQPFGSGQFVLVDYVFQQHIFMERNENYWNPDREINLAGVVMRQVPSESIIPSAIAGEINMGQATSSMDNLEALRGADTASEVLFVANTLRHVTFNTARPHLSDHRVRQALAYAFDTRAYIVADTGSPDLRTVGVAPFSPVSWAFPDPATLNDYEFNMERAGQLMDEAGWTMGDSGYRYNADGERFRLDWLIYHEAPWPGIITGMAAHTWGPGELGAELNIQMMDFTTVAALTSDMPPGEKDFDVFQMGWSMAIDPDLTGGLWDFDAHVAGGFNNSGWYNTRFQELIELGRSTFDQDERTAYYHELAAMANYYLPVWVLSNGTNLFALTDDVRNLEVSAFMGPFLALTQQGTWIAE
ncbi:MAG: ABC transporter substrate-binding protein [Clostridiales bacterium]|jgi:peptide/nickel transport system substrate-binding protein|nr:ABC transporter substrate-binding protein [Clostridiales bacterium]